MPEDPLTRPPALMPSACAPPSAVLAWLNTLRARDGVTQSLLLTMRWLVLEEMERLEPNVIPRVMASFTPEERNQFAPNL